MIYNTNFNPQKFLKCLEFKTKTDLELGIGNLRGNLLKIVAGVMGSPLHYMDTSSHKSGSPNLDTAIWDKIELIWDIQSIEEVQSP